MYLWFADFSQFTWALDDKGLMHNGVIIKVYPSVKDPRIILDNPDLVVVEESDKKLKTDYLYGDRGAWHAYKLEQYLSEKLGNNSLAIQAARALFRFSNRPDLMFCAVAMEHKKNGSYEPLINHPMEEIDGWMYPVNNSTRWAHLHLDVFFPGSIRILEKRILQSGLTPPSVLSMRDSIELINTIESGENDT